MDMEKLRDFVRKGEKSPPPVFVGRKAILKDIRERGFQAWKKREENPALRGEAGLTCIVQGAPGAGKSSLLAELARPLSESSDPDVIILSGSSLMTDIPSVVRALAMAGGMAGSKTGRAVKLHLGISALVQAGAEMSWPGGKAPDSLLQLVAAFPPAQWKRPVILAADEAQALSGDKHAPDALFLRDVHNAIHGFPVALALAGLGTTADCASGMDLTRGSTVHGIAGLDAGETALLLRRFCALFGLDASGSESRLEALAAPCEGWPRHLHFMMQALGRAALETEGALSRIDWNRVGAEAAESRQRYYAAQQSQEMKESRGLVAAGMQVTPGAGAGHGVDRSVILGAIRAHVREDDDSGYGLPEGMTRQRLFKHMVHRGALQMREDDTFHCPIPSFRSYLVHAGGLDLEAERARKDGDGTESLPQP